MATGERLGPLERDGDRWLVGDPRGRRGRTLAFTGEGVQRTESAGTVELLPWPRVMDAGLHTTTGRWASSRPVASAGRGTGSYLSATLRHPYEYWFFAFDHHRHRYAAREVVLADVLVRHAVETGAARLLGDADRLAEVVARLADGRALTVRAARHAVAQVLGG